MTIETVPNSDIQYYLLAYDKNGVERIDDPDIPGGRLSELVKELLTTQAITDVFLISHGWQGDVNAAREQCNKWIGAMLECEEDRKEIRQLRPGFNPMIIGLHWPSLPWGNEEFDLSATSFAAGKNSLEELVKDAADKIADSPKAKEALRIIFAAAMEEIDPPKLPPEVVNAYLVLQQEAGLASEGAKGAPGADAEPFDPEKFYQVEQNDIVSFGEMPGVGGILSVLRQLSFWKMKDRARIFGETGSASLLRELQSVAGDKDIHFHLMGHSFGCIVVSATVAGAGGDSSLIKPVDSLFLVQGALSLWAYCSDIPVVKGKPGYFYSLIHKHKVTGPIITTQSEHDTAVGRFYPIAAGIKRQVVLGVVEELPKYGALGSFGIRGDGISIEDQQMLSTDAHYSFEKGKIYNLESSHVINVGRGPAGAHSDIAKPEVAHAFWEAVKV